MVRFLLKQGARVNIRGAAGYYPLHWAVHSGNATVVRLLLEAGAKINVKNGSGDTPLEWALRYRRHRVARVLRAWQKKATSNHWLQTDAKKRA
jgi:ankyrin repeat protein